MNISSLDDAYGGEGAIAMSNEPPQPPTSHEFLNPPPPQNKLNHTQPPIGSGNPPPTRKHPPPARPVGTDLHMMQAALEGVDMQKRTRGHPDHDHDHDHNYKHNHNHARNQPYLADAPTRRRPTRGDTRQRFYKKTREAKIDDKHKKHVANLEADAKTTLEAEELAAASGSNNKRMGLAVIMGGCVFILVMCILFAIIWKRRKNNAPPVVYGPNGYNHMPAAQSFPSPPQVPPQFPHHTLAPWMYNTSPPMPPMPPVHVQSRTGTIPARVGDNVGVTIPPLGPSASEMG